MMSYFKLSRYNFRHLTLGITALTIVVLTLLVAFFSSHTAFDEMNRSLYLQSVHISKSMANDSIAPLLYDSNSGAQDMINTLIDMPQITEASIIRDSHTPLLKQREPEHIHHPYPVVSISEPFLASETNDGWYFSALVQTQQNGGSLTESFFEEEGDSPVASLGYINLGVSKKLIYESRHKIFIRNTIISASAGMVLLFIMYAVLRNLTRPLEKLSGLMEQGREGEYPETVDIKGTKEITEMAHIFNAMIIAIKEREENLSLTLDSIGDAVIATDAEGCVTRMNPVAENLTGWSLNQAKGRSVKEIFSIINASTRETIKNPVEKVLDSGETIYLSNHTTLISKDKTEYQIADSAAPIKNEDGSILGMVLVFNDVTEQYKLREIANRSRRDMQAVMDNYPAVISIRNIEGRFTFINQQFEILYNTSRHNVLDKTLDDIFNTEISNRISTNDTQVMDVGHALQYEEDIQLNDHLHNYLSIKFPLFDDKKNIYAICGISIDISDHKNQELQLRRSQKMDALGKLTGGVAHDYNNMLGVVMGYADILESQLAEQPKLAGFARKILHAGERGAKLTKKLLSFSSHKKTNADSLNINKLLLEERDMLEKVITARITLHLDLNDNLNFSYLDAGDLEDAIVNLCINAMHAIDNSGQLTIKTDNLTISEIDNNILKLKPGNYVRLSITDTGCGMDVATRDKIFEPFFTTKGEKGTGLGLAQVYGFVERSGGTIQVYSEPDQGTEFVLYFPAHSASKPSQHADETKPAADYKGKESILVVDDEPAMLDLICDILIPQGYKIICAENANRALELLKTETIDLMLSDIIMPETDGYQLASIVQKKYPQMKIQLASGFSDERHLNTGNHNLHVDLISKPYQAITLLKRIRCLLDQPAS